jgi:hypothetical protein
LRPLPEAAAGKRLIFVGHLRYPPNIDAATAHWRSSKREAW